MKDRLHPVFETLFDYAKSPEKPCFADLRQHLAFCSECRQHVEKITCVRKSLAMSPVQEGIKVEGVPFEKIAAYIKKDLNADEISSVKKRIEHEAAAQRAALHFALHSQTMDAYLLAKSMENMSPKIDPKENVTKHFSFISLLKSFVDWHPPAWNTVPVTASIVVLIVIPLVPVKQTTIPILAYQDEAYVIFSAPQQEALGIGFFSGVHRSKKSFDGVHVQIDEANQLMMAWNPINNVTQYTVTI